MGQITLYLDNATEKAMRSAAKASGLSLSRWVRRLIHEKTRDSWPASVAKLAGAWTDLPEAEEIRVAMGEDVPREPL